MVTQVLLRNTIDAWVSSSRSSRFGDTRLYVHSAALAYVNFTRPKLPAGATVTSAKFRVLPGGGDAGGASDITLHRLTSSFDPNALNWSALPTFSTQVATLARTWVGAIMEFDVTTEIQRIVDGGAWFGWRISSTKVDATQFIYGGQSTNPVELVIEYTSPPQVPVDLVPQANVSVSDPKPTLSWTTPGGVNSTQTHIQIQVATNAAFTTGVYTSDQIASSASSMDLDLITPAFTALANGQTRWWRVKIRNDSGVWSAYSAGAQFTYQNPFVVNITAPGATTADPTPDLTWTYNGTQAAWQVFVFEQTMYQGSLVETLVFDSGIQNNTATTFTIPEGVVAYDSTLRSYRAVVRVWEAGTLISVAGAPTYREDSQVWAWVPAGATSPVELEVNVWLAQRPGRIVRWRYTGATADRFIVQRTRANNGKVEVFQLNAAASREGATEWYQFLDFPKGRSEYTYQVLTVMANGTTSTWAASPVEIVKIDYRMPFVMSTGPTSERYFCLLNASIDPGLTEVSDVVIPVNGTPHLAQWALQKYQGHGEGLLSDDALPGIINAEQMKDNFLWLRENPRAAFFFQDEGFSGVIYNTAFTPIGRADGGTDYAVSFDFVQD